MAYRDASLLDSVPICTHAALKRIPFAAKGVNARIHLREEVFAPCQHRSSLALNAPAWTHSIHECIRMHASPRHRREIRAGPHERLRLIARRYHAPTSLLKGRKVRIHLAQA